MFSLLYEFLISLLFLISLPKLLYDYVVKKKYRKSLVKRLGFQFPSINKGNRKLIWVHAVSVGEVKAVTALVKLLSHSPEHPLVLISCLTETGHEESKRCLPDADYHVYLPFDLRCIVRPIMKKVAPDLLIISETDFWYNFLKAAKEVGASTALVNGKMSERSFHRMKKFSFFPRKLFSLIDCFCIQNSHYLDCFAALGIPKEKLHVTGNLKFDDEYPRLTSEQIQSWKQKLHITPENLVVVLGSSHNPEEQLVLEQMQEVWQKLPHVKLIIVPRHPERFEEVEELVKNDDRVVVVKVMGVLRQCYQLADVAIVAGSFTSRVGGHNILEPCWYGVPVIYGPYTFKQLEMVELMKKYEAGREVDSKDLGKVLLECLQNQGERERLGKNGLHMLENIQGATQKTVDLLKKI